MQTKQYSIAILASLMLVVGTMIASAGYGSNPVLMKNAQALPEDVCAPEEHFVGNETVQCFTPGVEPETTEVVEPPMVVPDAGEEGTGGEEAPVETPEPEPEPAVCPPVVEEPTPVEEEIVNEANTTAEEVISVVNETDATPEEVEAVEETTSEVVETVEETVTNGTESEVVETVAEEAVEAVDNATEGETPEVEESANDALINLLEGLVDAQQYNENLSADEKDELVNNLEEVKAELG